MIHLAVAFTVLMVVVVAALLLRIKRLTAALRLAEHGFAAAQARLAACVLEADSLEDDLPEAFAALQRNEPLGALQRITPMGARSATE